MLALRILAFIFLIPGALMVFSARQVVEKFKLDERVSCDFEHEMNEDELAQYKIGKAVLNFKMLGMLVVLPGLILVFIAFK